MSCWRFGVGTKGAIERNGGPRMTLVVSLLGPGDLPLMVGDLLVSGPEREGPQVKVPAAGLVEDVFPAGSGFTILGLRQKLAIVSDHCVVGWAGSQLAATHVVTALRSEAQQRRLTPDIVKGTIADAMGDVRGMEAAFLGLVLHGAELTRFHIGGIQFDTPRHRSVSAIGSGTETLRRMLTGGIANSRALPEEMPADIKTLFLAADIAGALLQVEIRFSQTLLEYYGGGYEIATLMDGRFAKRGDISYVFWHAELREDGSVFMGFPRCILTQDYVGDILRVRSATFQHAADADEPTSFSETLDAISPVYRKASRADVEAVPPPPRLAPAVCHSVFVRFPGGRWAVLNRIDVNIPLIGFVKRGADEILQIHDDFPKWVYNAIKNAPVPP